MAPSNAQVLAAREPHLHAAPLLAEIIQSGILQIRRAHQDAEFARGLELQKKRLCKTMVTPVPTSAISPSLANGSMLSRHVERQRQRARFKPILFADPVKPPRWSVWAPVELRRDVMAALEDYFVI
jgi:hypothetical protein